MKKKNLIIKHRVDLNSSVIQNHCFYILQIMVSKSHDDKSYRNNVPTRFDHVISYVDFTQV